MIEYNTNKINVKKVTRFVELAESVKGPAWKIFNIQNSKKAVPGKTCDKTPKQSP